MARWNPLDGRRIALGVTGSIAAYKAVAIASSLTQQGAAVDVIMTPEAAQLVRPLSFEAITHRPVSEAMFQLLNSEIVHVAIGRAAEALVVAPATAHSIAKLALGLADDLVCATALATQAPGLIAPAMETAMWRHQATQGHVATLRQRGWTVVDPEVGPLASGAEGEGRMAAPERIVDVLKALLAQDGDFAGWDVVVTAGGTREPIDPIRYLSNRSSGKMGRALAEAARDRGAHVTMISAAPDVPIEGVRFVSVDCAADMRDAVRQAVPGASLVVMAAAVADYRPTRAADRKIKKGDQPTSLELLPTVDILQEVSEIRGGQARPILVGFAAETENLLQNAQQKLAGKRLDLVVANDVTLPGSGFGSDFNKVTIVHRGKPELDLPLLPKIEVAHRVLDEVLQIDRAS